MVQGLIPRITCTFKLSSENAETRFVIASIVMRGWIMHDRKVVTIIFGCEVWHLFRNIWLCNWSFNFVFIFAFRSKNLLTSLNWIAPMVLHSPPICASYGRCRSKCCIRLKKAGGKIFSSLHSNTGATFSMFEMTAWDNSLAHSWRKKLLNFANTRQILSGR